MLASLYPCALGYLLRHGLHLIQYPYHGISLVDGGWCLSHLASSRSDTTTWLVVLRYRVSLYSTLVLRSYSCTKVVQATA